jgi:hypothetical protein
MTIYATPFKNRTKKTTGPSTDSGFESLDQVVAMMGEPLKTTRQMVIYGDMTDRIVYSTFVFTLSTHGLRTVDDPAINP